MIKKYYNLLVYIILINNTMNQQQLQLHRLNLFKPLSVIFFISFYSPLFIAMSGLGISIISNNLNGLVFIGWLLVATLIREAIYMWSSQTNKPNLPEICTMVTWNFSSYGNPIGYSIYILAFTLMYIWVPMITNGSYNVLVITSIIAYLVLVIGVNMQQGCIQDIFGIFIEVVPGAALAALITSTYYWSGLQKYLFFNETSSNKVVCSMPKKQTFKCAVYKNGEMIGSTTTGAN